MDKLFQPVMIAAIYWITVLCWVGVSLWEGKGRTPHTTTQDGRRSDWLCFFGVGVSGLIAFACKGLFPGVTLYKGRELFILGIALVWIGTFLRHYAVVTLGKYHVMTIYAEANQPIITSGPYRYIRHPSYLGGIVAVIGVAVALNSLPGALILVVFTVLALVRRIQIEDRYLITRLGKPYGVYAAQKNRLLPFVW